MKSRRRSTARDSESVPECIGERSLEPRRAERLTAVVDYSAQDLCGYPTRRGADYHTSDQSAREARIAGAMTTVRSPYDPPPGAGRTERKSPLPRRHAVPSPELCGWPEARDPLTLGERMVDPAHIVPARGLRVRLRITCAARAEPAAGPRGSWESSRK